MVRIAVLTDVHANLPALEAALHHLGRHGYDLLVHTGDAIGIGPFPAECLDRLLSLPDILLLMGNHDEYFAFGLSYIDTKRMGNGELEHQMWTHEQLDPSLRAVVREWPFYISETVDGLTVAFLHYPMTPERKFRSIIKEPNVAELEDVFSPYEGEVVFYGHHHPFSDLQGSRRYINPGSLGCAPSAVARYSVMDFGDGRLEVKHQQVPYDDTKLFEEFESRRVPEREFIYQAFLGGRFSS